MSHGFLSVSISCATLLVRIDPNTIVCPYLFGQTYYTPRACLINRKICQGQQKSRITTTLIYYARIPLYVCILCRRLWLPNAQPNHRNATENFCFSHLDFIDRLVRQSVLITSKQFQQHKVVKCEDHIE